MPESKPSKALIDLLKVTGGLYFNLPQATPHFSKLTESDYKLIFDLLSKPETWDEMSEIDKIKYITRFDNGTKMRTLFLSVS